MAEFLIKVADERGHLLQQVENGFSESEVRERYTQQGYLVYWVKPRGLTYNVTCHQWFNSGM